MNVVYGSPAGLTAAGGQFLTDGVPQVSARFGSAVTASNFGRSSQADLAVGVPNENQGAATTAGQVDVFYGASAGPSPGIRQVWSQDSAGIQDTAETNDSFGNSLTDDPTPPD